MSWTPINDYPGDQRYDEIPGWDDHRAFWGEIGPTDGGAWSWTIVASDLVGGIWEEEEGYTDTEAEAKAIVEAWRY